MVRYEECYAKLVLENFFPVRYCDLQIQDCPDLFTNDEKIGIEVTTAENPFEKAAQINAKISKGQVRNKQGAIREIEKCGGTYSKWGIVFSQEIDYVGALKDAIEKKIKKLNSSHYRDFQIYDLFVASNIEMDNDTLSDALESLEDKQSNNHRKFSRIYIVSPWNIYELDTSKQQYFLHAFPSETQTYLAKKARALLSKTE